jgi:hypothetical protein
VAELAPTTNSFKIPYQTKSCVSYLAQLDPIFMAQFFSELSGTSSSVLSTIKNLKIMRESASGSMCPTLILALLCFYHSGLGRQFTNGHQPHFLAASSIKILPICAPAFLIN